MHIADTHEQIQQTVAKTGIDALASLPPAAPYRAYCLAVIYFHELRQATLQYNNSVVEFHQFVISHFDPRAQTPIGVQAGMHQGFEQVQIQMSESRAELDNAIETHASKYTKA